MTVIRLTVHPTPNTVPPSHSKPDNQIAGWKTFNDTTQHIRFQYPENFQTTYIRPQNWPPTITVSTGSFFCKEKGQIAGEPLMIQKSIGDITYCIEDMTQGAAGTLFADYTYSFMKSGKLISVKFTVAYPQCDNYPDPQKSACQQERQTFDLDTLIDKLSRTISGQFSSSAKSVPIVASPKPNAKISE